MTPERVFQVIAAAGLLSGGWLYGEYWKKAGTAPANNGQASELKARNTELELKNNELADELAQVRSMLAKGPYPVPDELITWIEKDFGLVFLKGPDVRLASPATFRDVAESNLKMALGERLDVENVAWELIGLLPPDHLLRGQSIMVNTVGAKGILDLRKGQVLLAEKFDPESIPDSSVLVRLLAQQLAWQNYPRKEWKSRDDWQAWQATYVGAAATTQARYLRRRAAVNEAEWKDPETEREALLMQLSPALQGFSNFPFVDGNNHAQNFYLKSRTAWAEMLKNPASSTAEIIHAGEERAELADIPISNSANLLLGSDVLGELGLRLWLEPYVGNLVASGLAEHWRGDRYELRDHDKQNHLIWQIEMSSEKQARDLVREVEMSMMRHLREIQLEREIRIQCVGQRVTFFNLPKS